MLPLQNNRAWKRWLAKTYTPIARAIIKTKVGESLTKLEKVALARAEGSRVAKR